jgi:hypothetical protein
MLKRYLIVLLTFVVTSGAAYWYYTYNHEHSSLSDTAQVRMQVTGLGDNLREVPLLASNDLVGKAMDLHYAQYVRPDLLEKWKADPKNAPGRLTSSPWPDRIDVTGVTKNADGTYTVLGSIIEMAHGAGTTTAVSSSIPAKFTLSLGPDG